MLDLETGVDLEEADGAVAGDEELAGAGAVVAGLLQDGLRGVVEALQLVVGQERRGRLLDELLVAALQRAVARGDHDDVAVLVGDALGLDVARLVEELLDETLAAAEGGDRLAGGRLEELGDLLDRAGDLEAASAAAEDGLDRDGQAVLLGEGDDLVGVLRGLLGAGCERCVGALGDLLGLGLVAEGVDGRGRRADPDEVGVDDGLGEVGVLGEEAVAGVDAVGAGALRDGDDLLDREVGVARGRALERVGLVGHAHVDRVAVGLGVDGDAADAGVLAGSDDADRDLATVGDQDLLQGLAHEHSPRDGQAGRGAAPRAESRGSGRSWPDEVRHAGRASPLVQVNDR